MTISDFNKLPKDVQNLINQSFFDYLKETRKPLTSPEQKGEFVSNIEWRLDSGLTYFGPIKKFNPQK